jgi:heme/copper-type cytochrome/quinol oxidase subunit 2
MFGADRLPKGRVKRKRSKTLVVMLLPVLIFIGFMGWLIYAMKPHRRIPTKIQQQQTSPKMRKEPKKDDGVTFIPAIMEEPKEITGA